MKRFFINDVEREKWESTLFHFRAMDELASSLLGSLKRIQIPRSLLRYVTSVASSYMLIPRQLAARILYLLSFVFSTRYKRHFLLKDDVPSLDAHEATHCPCPLVHPCKKGMLGRYETSQIYLRNWWSDVGGREGNNNLIFRNSL